ncbi:hypothetical protein X474_10480 [Dethiosulfatarculus sandiegensis]|uniref:Uncharacterized protein n=1 Tax=Dethiosulfatarculus sandiegensis TaxID=1429043 RepID=A0A0D2JEJ4_9BACT|nr:hypothetical protein X474_10480 [Dethiosulfatarculus sandiegensis]
MNIIAIKSQNTSRMVDTYAKAKYDPIDFGDKLSGYFKKAAWAFPCLNLAFTEFLIGNLAGFTLKTHLAAKKLTGWKLT